MSAAFAALGLSAAWSAAAAACGHVEPTTIQATAIPAILAGRDLVASAPTGSGKTVAFALPLLQACGGAARQTSRETPRRTRALILVPTRELAAQVGEVLRDLARAVSSVSSDVSPPLKIAVLFGGVSVNPQMMALRGGAEVVVATPGRLLDLVEHHALSLGQVALLVLDEADRMLDAGFADEWARIRALLPARRQNLLFSATLPPAVQALANELLDDPLHIDVPAAEQEAPAIEQRAVQVDAARRTQLLHHLLQQQGWTRVLVFAATQFGSERVAHKLRKQGVKAAAFHGDLGQGARTQVLADFKAGRLQVLVATDVAARGIDIAQLPAVVNYDLPRSAVDHVHRIGRTARAGERGVAISFVSADSEAHFRLIEKRQLLRVPREQIAGFEPKDVAAVPANNGGIKGKRKSRKDKLREAAAHGD